MYDPAKPYKKDLIGRIKETWDTPYIHVREGIYPVFERNFSYPEVDHTDGIGTKGYYHWKKRSLKEAVIDALAMNLNDLALVGATPYKLQNHITIPEDTEEGVFKIIEQLKNECTKRNIAITGGETSHHNNLDSLDIGMTVSGFITKEQHRTPQVGNVVVGLKSNGLHSNGFTKVRALFGDEVRPEFIEPTKIYSDGVLPVYEKYDVHGMMHITGGAFTKIKDIASNVHVCIDAPDLLEPQKIFYDLYEKGIADKEMYQTFNCGIGYILFVSEEDAGKVISEIENSAVCGYVEKGAGITIQSAFNSTSIQV